MSVSGLFVDGPLAGRPVTFPGPVPPPRWHAWESTEDAWPAHPRRGQEGIMHGYELTQWAPPGLYLFRWAFSRRTERHESASLIRHPGGFP